MVNDPKLVTVRATGTQQEGMRSAIRCRRFEFVTDEPPEFGGSDQGPNPVEYVLGSLIGCASVVLRIVATETGFGYEGADFDIRGVLDIRGLEGVPGVSRHFQKVTGTVRVRTSQASQLAEVVKKVEDRCPVFNLIRDAGCDIQLNWVAVNG